jgi:hypothetical protein
MTDDRRQMTDGRRQMTDDRRARRIGAHLVPRFPGNGVYLPVVSWRGVCGSRLRGRLPGLVQCALQKQRLTSARRLHRPTAHRRQEWEQHEPSPESTTIDPSAHEWVIVWPDIPPSLVAACRQYRSRQGVPLHHEWLGCLWCVIASGFAAPNGLTLRLSVAQSVPSSGVYLTYTSFTSCPSSSITSVTPTTIAFAVLPQRDSPTVRAGRATLAVADVFHEQNAFDQISTTRAHLQNA